MSVALKIPRTPLTCADLTLKFPLGVTWKGKAPDVREALEVSLDNGLLLELW